MQIRMITLRTIMQNERWHTQKNTYYLVSFIWLSKLSETNLGVGVGSIRTLWFSLCGDEERKDWLGRDTKKLPEKMEMFCPGTEVQVTQVYPFVKIVWLKFVHFNIYV